MVNRKKNNWPKVLFIALLAVAVLSAGSFFVYKKIHKPTGIVNEKTTSTAPSAQENFTTSSDRQVSTTPENKGTAGISDTQGQQTATTDKSLWSTSKTGEITVYSPTKNSLLTKGDVLSGESNLSSVNYRVLDNVSGMIAEGQLTVSNGKFSGSISFNTTGTSGRIDVYGATDSGKEFGNVEIPVRFK